MRVNRIIEIDGMKKEADSRDDANALAPQLCCLYEITIPVFPFTSFRPNTQ